MANEYKMLITKVGAADEMPKPTERPEPQRDVLEFTGQQKTLFDGLTSKAPRLADMYKGALFALQNKRNPECLPHAALSIREIIYWAPEYLDLPRPSNVFLKPKVHDLKTKWEPLSTHVDDKGIFANSKASTPLLKLFLHECRDFFLWFTNNFKARKTEVANMLRTLDPHKIPLPEPLEKLRVDEWDNISGYFNRVTHHGDTDFKSFIQWLNAFEIFLLDRLCPRTHADFSNIDSIIEEANDQARDN